MHMTDKYEKAITATHQFSVALIANKNMVGWFSFVQAQILVVW